MNREDRISALPDDVLVGIVQLLDLRTGVRVGAVARRWRRLPRLLSDISIDVADLIPHPDAMENHNIMATYAYAARWLLAPTKHRTIRGLRLDFFYQSDDPPHLMHSIGQAVVESRADRWELTARTEAGTYGNKEQRELSRQRFMSFVGACPVAFRRLTSLTLHNLNLRNSDVHDILHTCERLEVLSLHRCETVGVPMWFLQIDAPSSSLVALELHDCYYFVVQLTSVPNLERLLCNSNRKHWGGVYLVLELGNVPRLHDISLSAYHLRQRQDLTASGFSAFCSNLRNIYLCDLNTHRMVWTLCILEAAPFLEKLSLKLYQPWADEYPCDKAVPDEKGGSGTRKFEHRSLALLEITGYELQQDIQVVQYIKLVTERAVCFKRVVLLQQCLKATRCSCARSSCLANEVHKIQSRKILADVLSSSIEISVARMT